MNLAVLWEAADGDADFARELAALYLAGIDEQLRLLRLAFIEGAMDRVGHIAHYSKGSSAACGALTLTALFDELAQLAQQDRFDQCRVVAAAIATEFVRVQQILRALQPAPGITA